MEIHGIGAALWKICRHTHSSICAYSHSFMGQESALIEAVSRLASEKNRQGSNRRRRKAQAEAGGRKRAEAFGEALKRENTAKEG